MANNQKIARGNYGILQAAPTDIKHMSMLAIRQSSHIS